MLQKLAQVSKGFFRRPPALVLTNKHKPGTKVRLGHFSTTDGRLWKRKLHGLEDFSAAIGNLGKGFGHISFSANAKLRRSVTPTVLSQAARKAWIRLRHYAPLIALRTDNEGERADSFIFTYASSSSSDVAAGWAEETIHFGTKKKSLEIRDLEMNKLWWDTSDHWNVELHIGRGLQAGEWHFGFSAPHWAIDAHLLLPLMDRFFEYLVVDIEGTAPEIEDLNWGEEIVQLPPSLVAVVRPEIRERPSQVPGLTEKSRLVGSPPTLFQRPVNICSSSDTSPRSHFIVLTPSETAAFHKICKTQGFTVTPVINSILLLADVETALRIAIEGGPESFRAVKESFDDADAFVIPINAINRRRAIHPDHMLLDSPLGAVAVAVEAFPTFHDMNAVRGCIQLSEASEIKTSMSQDVFWDGLVADAKDALAPGIPIPSDFLANQHALSAAMAMHATAVLQSGLLSSSIGDLSRYGVFDQWKSSAASTGTTEPALVVERLLFSSRMTAPTILSLAWQYDGQFNLHLQSSAQFHSEDAWRYFTGAVEDRIRHIVQSN